MEDYYSDTEDNSKVKNFLSNMSVFTRWYSYETGMQDSPPAAGRVSDILPFRRSAILARCFYFIGRIFL